jgi:eukaryotic-like serine/threonine-protein kinase
MTSANEITGEHDPLDRAIAEYVEAAEAGAPPDRMVFVARHPDLAERLHAFFADYDRLGRHATGFQMPGPEATNALDGASVNSQLPMVRYLGDYELLHEIARGGMGVVYKARQVSLNRTVAVKMILAGTYATEQEVQRFRAEAEAAANLDHPNILPIYEVGTHEGHQYFSMKLIGGGPLTTQRPSYQGNLQSAAKLVETLSRAVHYAHQRGILHRDLKPANILLEADGTPVITDFGLAKSMHGGSGLTQSGAVVGTPSYMPPEQARGAKDISTAADIYSLGAILYELLTGRPPFRGETIAQTLRQVEEQEPAAPRSINRRVDRDLSTIALKCLEKDPAKRYASAEELANDLARWQKGEPVIARRAGLFRRTRKWLVRNPVPAALLFVFITAAVIVTAALLQTQSALREAQWQTYVSSVQLASRELNENNHDQVLVNLDRAPERFRSWEWHHLNRRARPEEAIWSPGLGSMSAIDASHDGRVLVAATTSSQGLAARLDPDSGRVANYYPAPSGTSIDAGLKRLIAVSANGECIAIANNNDVLFFQSDGTYRHSLNWPSDQAPRGFSLDAIGAKLAVITKDHHLQVWDWASRQKLFDEPRENILSVRPAWRNEQQLVVAEKDTFRMIDLQDRQQNFDIPLADFDKTLRPEESIKDEPRAFLGLAISRDGRTIALGGIGIIVLVDLVERKAIRKLVAESAMRQPVKTYLNLEKLEFSPDSKYIVAVGEGDRAVRIWRLDTVTPVAVHYGHLQNPSGLAFLPGGNRVVTAGNDVQAHVWVVPPVDYPRVIPVTSYDPKNDFTETGLAAHLEISRDGQFLAVGEADGHVSLIDTAAEKVLWRTRPATREITQLAFSPDGSKIGVAPGWVGSHSARGANVIDQNRDGIVLDSRNGATLFKLASAPGQWSLVCSISFSPDSKFIYTASGMTDARLDIVRKWSTADGALVAEMDTEYVRLNPGSNSACEVTGIACDPSGRSELAIASTNVASAKIVSEANGSTKITLTFNQKAIHAFWVGYSRDGRYIVAHQHNSLSAWDRSPGLLERRSLKPLFHFDKLPHINQVAISPDGQRLALACNQFAIIRATRSGDELIRVPIPHGRCEAVAFHPDGKKLYTGSLRGVLCFEP